MNKAPRVVLTGYGCVSPIGKSAVETFEGLLLKASHFNKCSSIEGLKHSDLYPQDQYVSNINLSKEDFEKHAHRFVKTRSCAFLQMSLREALAHAQVSSDYILRNRKSIGISIGALSSNLTFLTENILKASSSSFESIHRMTMMNVLNNILGTVVAVELGIQGPSIVPSTACATGLSAIGDAYNLIKLNYADMFIVGAAEETLNLTSVWGARRMDVLNTRSDNYKLCAPFDYERKGIILGEGGGIMVIETLDSALKRGAKIIAEVLGYGISTDGNHFVKPDVNGEGAYSAMRNALLQMQANGDNFRPDEVFINAHATGTVAGDKSEALAIKNFLKLLSDRPDEGSITVTAHKGNIGHCFSAAGIIESIVGVMSLEKSVLPPINNFEKSDIEARELLLIKDATKTPNLKYMVKNSFGFGGVNNSVIFRKFE